MADADAPLPPELHPVPGTVRGRGRIVADLTDLLGSPTRRRAGVYRRALRREASRLRDHRRVIAVIIGGPLIDALNKSMGIGAGPRWEVALGIVYFVLGSLALRPVVEPDRRRRGPESATIA